MWGLMSVSRCSVSRNIHLLTPEEYDSASLRNIVLFPHRLSAMLLPHRNTALQTLIVRVSKNFLKNQNCSCKL